MPDRKRKSLFKILHKMQRKSGCCQKTGWDGSIKRTERGTDIVGHEERFTDCRRVVISSKSQNQQLCDMISLKV
jgi:hypothetical protein